MTTLKQLTALVEAQDNGATLESYGVITHKWYKIGRLDELNLDLIGDVRIKQPEIDRHDLVWCGYGVPEASNCDTWRERENDYRISGCDLSKNNGYRHLYRYKPQKVTEDDMYICDHADECNAMCHHGGPHEWEESCDEPCVCAEGKASHHCIPYVEQEVVPYTLDTFVKNLRELQAQWKETAKIIRSIDQDGAVAYLECVEELDQLINGNISPIEKWPDGTPFGVEVM